MEIYLDILKRVPLFYGIDAPSLLAMLGCLSAKVVTYRPNAIIFSEGDPAEYVGIVLSGEVQIVKDDFYGNRNILASLSEAQLFAESFACADVAVLPVSVLAMKETAIMHINLRKITTTCSNCCDFHSKLVYNMLRIVANKNVQLNQKIEFISKRTTREKLMAYLLQEAKKAGNNSFSIPFNRQELADFLFVDRSAMSNELCKLRNEEILNFSKNKFQLL